MKSHFRVQGRFDRAREATVTVDREHGLVTVRPLHSRRVYQLPLSWAAEAVFQHIVRFELARKRLLSAKKKGRSR